MRCSARDCASCSSDTTTSRSSARRSDGDEVPDLVRATDPDVVVMDLAMPRVGGIEATEALVRRGSRATVLVLTLSEEDASVLAAVRAGARGYLVKGAAAEPGGQRGAGPGRRACGVRTGPGRPDARLLRGRPSRELRAPVGARARGARAGRGRTVQPADRRTSWSSRRSPSATTSAPSWPSCRCPTGVRRCSASTAPGATRPFEQMFESNPSVGTTVGPPGQHVRRTAQRKAPR